MLAVPRDVERAGEMVVGLYLHLVEDKGQSPRFAEMLALRQGPALMTDDVMMSGVGTLESQFKNQPRRLQRIVQLARRRGYNPKPTDFYNSAVADSEGDPRAFLNHGQGRGDLRRTLEERGWSGEGLVDVKGREPVEDPHIPKRRLAPKIVERIRRRRLKENPDLARKDQGELRHEIVQRHGWDKSRL